MSAMSGRLLRFVIMGPPGGGKGTISERIVKDFPIKHLASGDLLRSHIANKTELGTQASAYMHRGELVPDSLVLSLVLHELQSSSASSQHLLLDGFPRTVSQARNLCSNVQIDAVMNLNVPFKVIVDRVKGRWVHPASGRTYNTEFNRPKVEGKDDITGEPLVQREDDKEEVVQQRLQTYSQLTEPVLSYFKELGLLVEFSGSYSNEIWPKVHQHLAKLVQPIQFTHYS